MPTFTYTGRTKTGEVIKGDRVADTMEKIGRAHV